MSTLVKTSVYEGDLILVNPQNPYRGRAGQLIPPCEGRPDVLIERRAAVLLGRLMAEVGGWDSIVPVSGWRSMGEQQAIWDSSVTENGEEFTRKYVAIPGHSEHQSGLAIDLGLRSERVDFIRPDFPYSGICQTVRGRAAGFGFIQRYPRGKEGITQISHEPWHFRYVGIPHARIMTIKDFTLEEYHTFLAARREVLVRHGNSTFKLCYVPSGDELPDTEEGHIARTISGTNTDGYIITDWMDEG